MLRDEPAEHGHLVLIVDDDPLVLLTARRALERHGLRVTIAHNGMEALSRLEDDPPDLVLTDVLMPHMNGIALARHLRQSHPHLRVLFMSGYVGQDTPECITELNFIRKPFSYRVLVERVLATLPSEARHNAPSEPFSAP